MGTSLTETRLEQARVDAESLSEFVHSTADTMNTRLGKVSDTLTGYLKRLNYEPPVAYAAGLAITRHTQTVTEGGTIYAPLVVPQNPTVAAFDPTQWSVVQLDISQVDFATAIGMDLDPKANREYVEFYDRPGRWRKVTTAPGPPAEGYSWFTDTAGNMWEIEPVNGMVNAKSLGVVYGTVDAAQRVQNTICVRAVNQLPAGTGVLFDEPDTVQFDDAGALSPDAGVLHLGAGRELRGTEGQLGTVFEFSDLTKAGIQCIGRSTKIEHILINSTADRYNNGADTAHGIVIKGLGDDVSSYSSSRTFIHNVQVSRQPGAGIRGYGQMEYAEFYSTTITDNKGAGIHLDDGHGVASLDTTGASAGGLISIDKPWIADNGGPAIWLGNLTSTRKPYRLRLDQLETSANCHRVESCPHMPARSLPANPIEFTNNSDRAVVTLERNPMYMGHYAKFSGLTAAAGLSAAQLTGYLPISAHLGNDKFEVVLPTPATSTVVAGGGNSGTVQQVVRSQWAFFGCSSMQIRGSAGAGDHNFNKTVGDRGQPRLAHPYPGHSVFMWDCDACQVALVRCIETSNGIMLDHDGAEDTSRPGVPTTMCSGINITDLRAINTLSTGEHTVIIPHNSGGVTLENLVFVSPATHANPVSCLDPDVNYSYAGDRYYCNPHSRTTDLRYSFRPISKDIISGALTTDDLHVAMVPEGGLTKDTVSQIFVSGDNGIRPLPDGIEMTLVASGAGKVIHVRETSAGNIQGGCFTVQSGGALKLIGAGGKAAIPSGDFLEWVTSTDLDLEGCKFQRRTLTAATTFGVTGSVTGSRAKEFMFQITPAGNTYTIPAANDPGGNYTQPGYSPFIIKFVVDSTGTPKFAGLS